jgi:hypothetical protein
MTTGAEVPKQSKSDSSASRRTRKQSMSNYFSAIAVLMMVLSPLFVPIAVTVAPLASSGVRRIGRVFGLYRPAPRFA